jgi:hypothetical protein
MQSRRTLQASLEEHGVGEEADVVGVVVGPAAVMTGRKT